MRFVILLAMFVLSVSFSAFGQTKKATETHTHKKNEIGIAISPAYFIKEEVMTFAMHVHYTRAIAETKFAVGASFERIILDPKHSTYGMLLTYYPIEDLSFTLSPGVTFEDDNPGAFFALHIETAYTFDVGKYHIGPAIELAYDPNDIHLSIGVHIGYGF